MRGQRRAYIVTALLVIDVVAGNNNFFSSFRARMNIFSTNSESLPRLPTLQSVEHVYPSFQNRRANPVSVKKLNSREMNSFPPSSENAFQSTRKSGSVQQANAFRPGIYSNVAKDKNLLYPRWLDASRSREVVRQGPMFWPQQINAKSSKLPIRNEDEQLTNQVNQATKQNSRERALPHSYLAIKRSYDISVPNKQININKPNEGRSSENSHTMEIHTLFKDIKHHLDESESRNLQEENHIIDLYNTSDGSLSDQTPLQTLNPDYNLFFVTREQRELDFRLISRLQNIFSEFLGTKASLPITSIRRSRANDFQKGTKVESISEENVFTKLKKLFTSWSWNQDKNNQDEMKIEFEDENDPVDESKADLMKVQLIEKLEPILEDTFGYSNFTGNELMDILENPISIKDKLISKTSYKHARELTDTFSSYEGLPHSSLVEKLENTEPSSMTGFLSSVGSEIRDSLYEMFGPAAEELSDVGTVANGSPVSRETNEIQPKNINISFAISTSPYKNTSFFGGHNFSKFASSYFNFTKIPRNYTTVPDLYGAHLAALPILATLTTGALFGLGGVLAILLASHYHYKDKKDYDYDYEGYGHSTGYHSNPLIIALPVDEGKGGYGSHSPNVKYSRSKTVRGKVTKGNRVRPHRGSSHRPHKHGGGGGGGGGGGYSHHRHDDGKSYFYEDDFDPGRTSEKIDWIYSKERDLPRFVRLASEEIEDASIIDSSVLFGSPFDKKSQSREFKVIYGSKELKGKRKAQIYSGEIIGRSSEGSRHDKRDIYESWEEGRKSIYKPLKEANKRPADRRRQPERKRGSSSPYRGTLVLNERSPLEDILFGDNSRRRSSSKWKRKSWRDRDNVAQHSTFDDAFVPLDGESPLSEVGKIPGIDWTLESMSNEAESAAVKDLVIMSDNPLDERWRSIEGDEDMFKADSTLHARRKLNALLDRYREYTRDVFIDGGGTAMPMALPLAAEPPTPAVDPGVGALQSTPRSTESFQRRVLRVNSAEEVPDAPQSPEINLPAFKQRYVDHRLISQPGTNSAPAPQHFSSQRGTLESGHSKVSQAQQPSSSLSPRQPIRNFAQFSGD